MMQELQKRLLLANEARQIDLLREACLSPEGQQWCLQRFAWEDILEWMWQERNGDFNLLERWAIPEGLRPLLECLVPQGYQSDKLAGLLFPRPSNYQLNVQTGWKAPHPFPLEGRLARIVRNRILEIPKLPHNLKARATLDGCVIRVASNQASRISLEQIPLEESGAEVVAYGAKDNGEMGGGAAGCLLVEAGSALEDAARKELDHRSREIGEVFLTPAFGRLLERGTLWVCHIISILKHTPQGSYCPHPERLKDGVYEAMRLAQDQELETMAISALATGEGRVAPEHSARLMLGAARRFFREHPESALRLVVCLPSDRDLSAFERELSHPSE